MAIHNVDVKETVKAADHIASTTNRDDKVVDFGESDRKGRSTSATVVDGRTIEQLNLGPPPQNEEGSLQACERLIRHLKGPPFQRSYAMPQPSDSPDLDAESADREGGPPLLMQVVRARVDPTIYKELAKTAEHRSRMRVEALVEQLSRAINLKIDKLPTASQKGVTLVLDAMESPGACLTDVVDRFKAAGPIRDNAFAAIWLVGQTQDLIHQLK